MDSINEIIENESQKHQLTREELADKFYGYHSKNSINDNMKAFEYLKNIQEFLNNYKYTTDNDFILEGRKKEIYDEIVDILNVNNEVKDPIYFVLGSLEEFMSNNNFIYPSVLNYSEAREKNDRYSSKGIICFEEKEYIEDIINRIIKYINI